MGEPQKRTCCCPSCVVGDVIPKWENLTKVRPQDDSGGTHYTQAPYGRKNPGIWNSENPGDLCSAHPPGFCGQWISPVGDKGGPSAQQIQDTVDDIMACATPDSGHVTADHNCYHLSGTVDMKPALFGGKLFGFQQVLAQKFWHGIKSVVDQTDPNRPTGVTFDAGDANTHSAFTGVVTTFQNTAPQTKYLAAELTVDAHKNAGASGSSITPTNDDWYDHRHCRSSIGRLTGVETRASEYAATAAGDSSPTPIDLASGIFSFLAGLTLAGAYSYFAIFITTPSGGPWPTGTTYSASGGDYKVTIPSFSQPYTGTDGMTYTVTDPAYAIEEITISGTSFSRTVQGVIQLAGSGTGDYTRPIGTVMTETLTFNGTGWNYSRNDYLDITSPYNSNPSNYYLYDNRTFTASMIYDTAYTADNVKSDWKALLNSWDMSLLNLAQFRTDELMALSPLCVYDEIGPSVPALLVGAPDVSVFSGHLTMDDFSALTDDSSGNHPGDPGYVTTWAQTTWHDPQDFYWQYNHNSRTQPGGWAGGDAVLKTGVRSGDIIAHTQAGSERHFWFGAQTYRREDTGSGFIWVLDDYGQYSNSNLPPVTQRWLDDFQAQYDALAVSPKPGNFRQGWWSEKSSVMRGGKFVLVPQKWPSVNFGRPCGVDKYAVDSSTACCITTNAAPVFTVALTGEAAAPPADGKYILVGGDGVYHVDSHTGSGPWVLHCTRLDDVTDGALGDQSVTVGVLAALRWPSSSGICGRAGITTAFDSGTGLLTVSSSGLPYLRKDPATGNISVDLCDSAMTVLATVNLTRVSDASFTVSHSALPAAVWMKGAGVAWANYDATSHRTAVYLTWTFNARAAYWSVPPTWFAGTTGCTAGSKEQFTYSDNCRTACAILPDGSPESFPGQVVRSMDLTAPFDDYYGAHWQGYMALTMPDQFWSRPYKPDCDIVDPDSMTWTEDDGSGQADTEEVTGGSTIFHKFFVHHPLVEALATIPGGLSLPSGVSLFYAADIAPPDYPNGISIGDAGAYAAIEQDWGFGIRACDDIAGSGRFSDIYSTFVSC